MEEQWTVFICWFPFNLFWGTQCADTNCHHHRPFHCNCAKHSNEEASTTPVESHSGWTVDNNFDDLPITLFWQFLFWWVLWTDRDVFACSHCIWTTGCFTSGFWFLFWKSLFARHFQVFPVAGNILSLYLLLSTEQLFSLFSSCTSGCSSQSWTSRPLPGLPISRLTFSWQERCCY